MPKHRPSLPIIFFFLLFFFSFSMRALLSPARGLLRTDTHKSRKYRCLCFSTAVQTRRKYFHSNNPRFQNVKSKHREIYREKSFTNFGEGRGKYRRNNTKSRVTRFANVFFFLSFFSSNRRVSSTKRWVREIRDSIGAFLKVGGYYIATGMCMDEKKVAGGDDSISPHE